MAIVKITMDALRCDRCAHEWVPRGDITLEALPKQCPACHSPYWNDGPVKRKSVSRAAKRRGRSGTP
jgi:hypothetical protein